MDPNKLGELYLQKFMQTGNATMGFTGEGNDLDPHSDFWQDGKQGALWRMYIADALIKQAYQTFFYPPEKTSLHGYWVGQTAFLENVVLASNPRFSNDTNNRVVHFHPYRAEGIYDFSAGKYYATDMKNVWIEDDARVTDKKDFFNPANPGGQQISISGGLYSFPTAVGGAHSKPLYVGECRLSSSPPEVITAAEVGDDHRITSAAALQAMWPGGTF